MINEVLKINLMDTKWFITVKHINTIYLFKITSLFVNIKTKSLIERKKS